MLSPPPKIFFFSASKKLLKNRNCTFPVVPSFTGKLEFISNISSMTTVTWMLLDFDENFKRNTEKISAIFLGLESLVSTLYDA